MNIYDYVRPLGKIDDDSELRDKFIKLYDTKNHQQIVHFCLKLGHHLIEKTGFTPEDEILQAFAHMQAWLDGSTNYHPARNTSFAISRLARVEKNPVRIRFLRTMAQITASPHVKYHGLWATDFAVTLINRIYPGDKIAVQNERLRQIELLKLS